MTYLLIPAEPLTRPGLGLPRFGLNVLWDVAITAIRRRPRLRKALRAQFGEDGPFRCVVILDASGLSVDQLDATVVRPWTAIRDVVDTGHGVEFHSKEGDLTRVLSCAFASAIDRSRFIAIAREYLDRKGALANTHGC